MMRFHSKTFHVETRAPIELIDVTSEVRHYVEGLGLKQGQLVISSRHTTVGVVLNERCEELQKDMLEFLKRLAPPEGDYRHNRVASDGRPNAHSHLISLLIPSSQTVLLEEGRLSLGPWQSIFLVELDGPRSERKLTLAAMGE